MSKVEVMKFPTGTPVLVNTPGGVVQSIVEGTNITVDNTDPANPIVSATGSSLELTDGTNDIVNVAKITVTGGVVGGTTPNATLTINAGSSLEVTDGVHDIVSVAKITVTGGVVGGTTPNATLAITGGAQTPWASNINAGGFDLCNVSNITVCCGIDIGNGCNCIQAGNYYGYVCFQDCTYFNSLVFFNSNVDFCCTDVSFENGTCIDGGLVFNNCINFCSCIDFYGDTTFHCCTNVNFENACVNFDCTTNVCFGGYVSFAGACLSFCGGACVNFDCTTNVCFGGYVSFAGACLSFCGGACVNFDCTTNVCFGGYVSFAGACLSFCGGACVNFDCTTYVSFDGGVSFNSNGCVNFQTFTYFCSCEIYMLDLQSNDPTIPGKLFTQNIPGVGNVIVISAG